jgi:CheY-like chemotaxis protein
MNYMETVSKQRYPDLIYVVEDDPDVSQLIEHNLRTAGYEVSTFLSGAPVLPQAAMAQPSLFLLDIMLPGINGFDLCRQIRQHERLLKNQIAFRPSTPAATDTSPSHSVRVNCWPVFAMFYALKPNLPTMNFFKSETWKSISLR